MKMMETLNRKGFLFFFLALAHPKEPVCDGHINALWSFPLPGLWTSKIIIFTCIKHTMNENNVVLRQQDFGVNLLLQYNLPKTNTITTRGKAC